MSPRGAAFALAASAAALFAGCSSSAPNHEAAKAKTPHRHAAATTSTTTTVPATAPTALTTTTTTAPPSSATTTPPGQSTTTSPGPNPVPVAATGPCDRMSAATGQTTGAAGTIVGTIVVTNTGSETCTATGYPTMTLFSSSGSPLTETVVKGLSVSFTPPAANAPPATTTIGPSGTAEFAYQFSDVVNGPGASCQASASASVTIPGATKPSSSFPLAISPCGTIRVSPMYSG